MVVLLKYLSSAYLPNMWVHHQLIGGHGKMLHG